jgi:hypothetical protein
MIDLASDRWGELQHAYGLASDVPAMLTRLSRAADAEARRQAWEPIWSALCHQGDVYSASYAAIADTCRCRTIIPRRDRAAHSYDWRHPL